jgi:hypothetical protein
MAESGGSIGGAGLLGRAAWDSVSRETDSGLLDPHRDLFGAEQLLQLDPEAANRRHLTRPSHVAKQMRATFRVSFIETECATRSMRHQTTGATLRV